MSSVCARCEKKIETVNHRDPADFPLCPECAEREPVVHVFASDSGKLHEDISLKKRRPGERKPFEERKSGESLEYRTGTWRDREQRVDRDNDGYDKVVKDQATGVIIHECHEPLSRHQVTARSKEA